MGFDNAATVLLAGSMLLHLMLCPYTKVEESFGLQAMHDLIFNKADLAKYDHNVFPGVVPRTFIGPAAVAATAYPFVAVAEQLQEPTIDNEPTKLYAQFCVRATLGILLVVAFRKFQQSISKLFGNDVGSLCAVISAVQFHFPFYLSRPLPNIFAMALILVALSAWLQETPEHGAFIAAFVPAVVVFRAELVVLLGCIMLMELVGRRITFGTMLSKGFMVGFVWLGISIAFDSVFWGRLLWPEGEVLYFNTVMNKSKEWGVLPFWWYFYSAIPKSMSATVVLVPIGALYDTRIRKMLMPVLGFVLLYSILPHKELRFIIYVFPALNAAAAVGAVRLWRQKHSMGPILKLGVVGIFCITLCSTVLFSLASQANYPGGAALEKLHQHAKSFPQEQIRVHISVPPAQTGISLFAESTSGRFVYSKAEVWTADEHPEVYDVMLTGPDGATDYPNRTTLFSIAGFDGISLQKSWPFLHLRKSAKIMAMAKG